MDAYVICVWLHVAAAATWIGSMVFFAAVVVPLVRREELRAAAPALLASVGRRFRIVGWIALATLLVTGVGNLYLRGFSWALLTNAGFWAQGFGFGRWFVWKLVLVAIVVAVTIAHEVIALRAAAPRRWVSSLLGRSVMILSLGILLLAVAMVRGYT